MDDLKKGVERALRIVQFNRAAITETADDPGAFQIGIVIAAIGGFASGIGGIRTSVSGLVIGPIGAVIGSFIGAGIIFLMGMILKPPTWDFMRLYRPLSHASILSWAGVISIVPFVGSLVMLAVALYQIAVMVVTIETVGQCDRTKAILIVVIPFVVCCVIPAVIFGGVILAALGLGGMAALGQ